MYAIRRIKDGFRMHKLESDKATIEKLIKHAEHSFGVIQRQVMHFVTDSRCWEKLAPFPLCIFPYISRLGLRLTVMQVGTCLGVIVSGRGANVREQMLSTFVHLSLSWCYIMYIMLHLKL